ncbi:MAG: NAD(P)/FAD-dependent oxidoreductase, partial [Bacteroidota bacterium]
TLGIATPFMASLLTSCNKENIQFFEAVPADFNGKIIVVGAGAAGLIAGHILQQNNIDFQIIEASDRFGGRVKKAANFVDFPIDLGGEWIHTNPSILAKLLNEPDSEANIDIISYNPKKISVWKDGKLKKRNFASHFYGEYKFKSTTWYGFFEQHVVPNFSDKIVYNSPINAIDYTSDKVIVTNHQDEIFTADKVIVTVPIPILQKEYIQFSPPLPSEKVAAINSVTIPDGIKAFIEFSERFYPDVTFADGGLLDGGDTLYYDAAFGKETQANVLALFSVSAATSRYTDLDSESAIFEKIMGELDEIFDGQATKYYQKHIIQNWSKEPFIGGSYSHYDNYDDMDILRTPLANKVFFAGEALHPTDSSTVHGAGESGYQAVMDLLKAS